MLICAFLPLIFISREIYAICCENVLPRNLNRDAQIYAGG